MEQFKDLTLGLIEQGDLLVDADEKLSDLQQRLICHVERYGDKADGAAVELGIKIKIKYKAQHDAYVVVSSVSGKTPSRPDRSTVAMPGETDEGRPTLMVSPSGSRRDHPRQGIIVTDTGEAVDPTTGEVVGTDAAANG